MVGMPPDKKLTNVIGGPVPGMSLTAEPGSRPWEQPPQYNTPEEALDSVIPRIMSAEVGRDMIEAMDRGISAEDLTDGILIMGFSDGKWTVDVAVQMAIPVFLAVINSVENLGEDARVDSTDEGNPELDALEEDKIKLMEMSEAEEEGADILEDSDEETPDDAPVMGSGMMPPPKDSSGAMGMEDMTDEL